MRKDVVLKALPAPQAASSDSDGGGRVFQSAERRGGLSSTLAFILTDVQRELANRYNGEEQEAEDLRARSSSYVEQLISEVASKHGFEISSFERDEILKQVELEDKPFGILQALVDDQEVSDIIVTNSAQVAVQRARSNTPTTLSFASPAIYETFVERLLQKAGTTYSTRKPIADGMIGQHARIHVVHRCLCESGPYLTIRINRFSRVTVKDLASRGMAPMEVFNYLSSMIQTGQTVLVVGEVGTGKTTLARVLANCVPPEESILVIEDTPEIQLEHPHVRYVSTREPNSEGVGRVAPAECIRAGMRMAMNRIIFGEMRDAEAAEAFVDVCASGHPGLSTIHAKSAMDAVARLELFLGRAQRGVTRNVLTEQIATAVQAIVHVDICRVTGKRRIFEVREIGPVADGVLRQRELFRYQVADEVPQWRLVNKVSAHREKIEGLDTPCILSGLPSILELSEKVLMNESRARTSNLEFVAKARRAHEF